MIIIIVLGKCEEQVTWPLSFREVGVNLPRVLTRDVTCCGFLVFFKSVLMNVMLVTETLFFLWRRKNRDVFSVCLSLLSLPSKYWPLKLRVTSLKMTQRQNRDCRGLFPRPTEGVRRLRHQPIRKLLPWPKWVTEVVFYGIHAQIDRSSSSVSLMNGRWAGGDLTDLSFRPFDKYSYYCIRARQVSNVSSMRFGRKSN